MPAALAGDIWQQRRRADHAERRREPNPACLPDFALRSAQRKRDDTKHDRRDAADLAAADPFVEHARADQQQRQQTGGQHRLDERQRHQQQSDHLHQPSDQRQPGPGEPPSFGCEPLQ
jgi:uncharacterized protein with von Willebrand factor type A (vWA) domain